MISPLEGCVFERVEGKDRKITEEEKEEGGREKEKERIPMGQHL